MRRRIPQGILLVLVVLSVLVPAAAVAQGERPRVLAVHLDNDINPVTQEYLENAVERGEDDGFAAVVVILDTPGGLSSSMRGIVKRFLAATVPVVLYVSPPGSSADSAGAVIAMAADIAAMAPQTNIGSSTPISIGGEDISKDLRRKVVNDAAAYVGELAREHGRNVKAARLMVTKASNYGARDAFEIGLVEVVSPTLRTLLDEIDGRKTVPKGLVLKTAGAEIEEVEMTFWQRARDLLVDPNLIALMLSIGLLGIVVELWNPGLILPGTVGAISLILGLYGLQVLPVSIAGLLLMLLAAAFFVTEAFVPTHGALTLAGAITFVLGALILFDPAGDAYQVSLPVAVAIAGTLAVLLLFAFSRVVLVARRPAAVGSHGLVGMEGIVKRNGLVSVNGELWRASASAGTPLVHGEHVRVERVEDDLRIVVGSIPTPTEELL
ncbi:MAG: nodulation protein NfeD [Actinobacteria bacterium]|nr:nodulation protein NfeD [Actinomycetota bacterium]